MSIKLWAAVAFAVIAISGILVAFAIEQPKVTPIETSQIGKPPQPAPKPPENATLIPGLSSTPFDLSLDTSEVTVSKGESVNITVTVCSTEKADLLLMIETENYTPVWIDPSMPPELQTRLYPELPPGITASLDRTEISVEADIVTANLTLSIGDQAASGRYTLEVSAIQKTFYGSAAVSVPLQLTIP